MYYFQLDEGILVASWASAGRSPALATAAAPPLEPAPTPAQAPVLPLVHVCVPGRSNYRFVCISARTWLMISVLSRTRARARARAVGRPTPTSAIVRCTMANLRYSAVQVLIVTIGCPSFCPRGSRGCYGRCADDSKKFQPGYHPYLSVEKDQPKSATRVCAVDSRLSTRRAEPTR